MKKVVLELELHDEKNRQKAMKAVSCFSGVDSISVDMKNQKLTLTGDVDPVKIALKLRKLSHTHIVSVEEAKGEGKKKEEPKKEAPKEGQVLFANPYQFHAYNLPYMTTQPPHYYGSIVEEDPNSCVIC